MLGELTDDPDQLRQAVTTLESSPARLEHAKALVALGRRLRLAGDRSDALNHVRLAADLADRCGAAPLLVLANAEIRACGAKTRRSGQAGDVVELTGGERRVALLAAQGHRNTDIAQQLFVTTKTVEVHLGNVYRKLGVTRRELTTDLLT